MAKGAEKKAEQRKAAELKMNGTVVVIVSVSYSCGRISCFVNAPSYAGNLLGNPLGFSRATFLPVAVDRSCYTIWYLLLCGSQHCRCSCSCTHGQRRHGRLVCGCILPAAGCAVARGAYRRVWRDLLYITAIVQLGSLWTDYAWQLLWLVRWMPSSQSEPCTYGHPLCRSRHTLRTQHSL